MSFWCLQFSQKTNLKTPIFSLAHWGRNFLFVFWENWKKKCPFEINWPLKKCCIVNGNPLFKILFYCFCSIFPGFPLNLKYFPVPFENLDMRKKLLELCIYINLHNSREEYLKYVYIRPYLGPSVWMKISWLDLAEKVPT